MNDNKVMTLYAQRDDNGVSFFDENNNCIAVSKPPYPLMKTNEYREMPDEVLNQIDSLWSELQKVAKSLDIREEDIQAISQSPIKQRVDDKKLRLDDEKGTDTDETKEHNEEVLSTLGIKQETKMSTRVNDRYTLGELLGVDDPGATLVCVYSGSVSERTSNSLYSFLIKHSDGSLEKADMLSQIDGTMPSREVNSFNRDGTSLEQEKVRSMYRFVTPNGKEAMISVSYGASGTLKLQYGEIDITNNNQFMAVPLQTTDQSTRFVTKQTQETLDTDRGIYNTYRANKEIDYHRDASSKERENCEIGLAEADGNPETGHQHLDEENLMVIASNIINKNPELDEFYSVKGLADELKAYIDRNPDKPINQSIEDFTDGALENCSHINSRKR